MSVKLHYANGRGLAEVIRIALGAAEIEFEESFIMSKQELTSLQEEGNLMFNQVPLLEIDGVQLIQSKSILRYICRKQGWLGKNAEESVRIDMLTEGARDAYNMISPAYSLSIEKDNPQEWEDAIAKAKSRYLPVFEKELESTGTGYLVGNSLTMCDIALLDMITWIAEKATEVLEEYPNILNFIMKMTSHPGIQKFLDGPQRKPLPDADYIKIIKTTYYD